MITSAGTGLVAGLRPRFLEGLAPADLNAILAAASQQRLPANFVVTNHGDLATRLFLLIKGRARFFYIGLRRVRYLALWPLCRILPSIWSAQKC